MERYNLLLSEINRPVDQKTFVQQCIGFIKIFIYSTCKRKESHILKYLQGGCCRQNETLSDIHLVVLFPKLSLWSMNTSCNQGKVQFKNKVK